MFLRLAARRLGASTIETSTGIRYPFGKFVASFTPAPYSFAYGQGCAAVLRSRLWHAQLARATVVLRDPGSGVDGGLHERAVPWQRRDPVLGAGEHDQADTGKVQDLLSDLRPKVDAEGTHLVSVVQCYWLSA